MSRQFRQISGIVVVGMVVLLLTGCVTDRPARFGVVREVHGNRGDLTSDFSFLSENGKVDKFSHVRGDVTILVFTDHPNWPICQKCQQIVDLASRLSRVQTKVTAISVFKPSDSCRDRADVFRGCQIEGQAPLLALCDEDGYLHGLFGPRAEGKFFVINADGYIENTGQLNDLNALESSVRHIVDEHEAYCNRLYGSQELDWPH